MDDWTFDVDRHDIARFRRAECDTDTGTDAHTTVRIDHFAFTANNLTYAATGDTIGYWRLFERPEPWGAIPMWGTATVLSSDTLDVGTRAYGLWPPASRASLALRRGRSALHTVGGARGSLNPVYNAYADVTGVPEHELELRAALQPLYALGFVLGQYLREHPAATMIVTSASSKTALAAAHALPDRKILGLTSAHNVEFAAACGRYGEVLAYDDVEAVTSPDALIIDVAGDAALIERLRAQLGRVPVITVGSTHGGPQPADTEFFFAPTHMSRLIDQWGAAAFGQRLERGFADFTATIAGSVELVHIDGPDAFVARYEQLLANRVPPSELSIVRPVDNPD